MLKRISKGHHIQRVAAVAELSDRIPANVRPILQRSDGKSHERCTAIHSEQVWLSANLADKLSDNRRARLKFAMHRVPDLHATGAYSTIEGVRDAMQRRRKPLIG